MTTHGGHLDAARARFPDAPGPWIDLSTGINPHAYPTEGIAIDWHALPSETELATLERTAAAAFGTRQAICALPGTEIGLRLLTGLGLEGPMHHVGPSYGTYAEMGSIAVSADAVPATETLLIANPNNPDGRVTSPERLLDLAHETGLLVVDEAFADIDPTISILPHLGLEDPVLVFRSFGKMYGLAGVRLGFACGPAPIVAQIRKALGSWPVSAAAIAIGTAAYRDTRWLAETRTRIARDAVRLDALLAKHGLAPIGRCPLFRLVDTPHAPALFDRLGHAGILIRPFAYAPTWLRFGLPADESAWARLDAALHG